MDYWEKKIAAAALGDPVKALKRDKDLFKQMKEENERLKEENRKLSKNNQTLVSLVELMEEKIKGLTLDVNRNTTYSYEHGGWLDKDAMDKGKIELAPDQVNVDSINSQLAEILRMIERNRMKGK